VQGGTLLLQLHHFAVGAQKRTDFGSLFDVDFCVEVFVRRCKLQDLRRNLASDRDVVQFLGPPSILRALCWRELPRLRRDRPLCRVHVARCAKTLEWPVLPFSIIEETRD